MKRGLILRGAVRFLLLLTALSLLAVPQGCTVVRKRYECKDEADGAACHCRQITRVSERVPCKKKYDCCVEYAYSSWMPDDPGESAGCVCRMLDPGESCEGMARSYERPGMSVRVDLTCPPS